VLPDQAFRLAKAIPGANVELVRGLGHLMHEEDPRRLADIVVKAAESLTAQALTH
jgi:magnesium chelatase accessory protein